MQSPFILVQLILAGGMAVYLPCRLLFRVRPGLPLLLAWVLVAAALFASGMFAGLIAVSLLIGFFCSGFGMFFFFWKEEEDKGLAYAFLMLWPVSAICEFGAFRIVDYFTPEDGISGSEHLYTLLGGLSPNIAAFLVWLFQRFRIK